MRKSKQFSTIQVDSFVKEQIVDYCSRNDLKIGRFIQRLFLSHVSGSGTDRTLVVKSLLLDSATTLTPAADENEDYTEFVQARKLRPFRKKRKSIIQ